MQCSLGCKTIRVSAILCARASAQNGAAACMWLVGMLNMDVHVAAGHPHGASRRTRAWARLRDGGQGNC
eukprot:11184613-Lingulodinium_polyedra.AAC.1